MTQRRRSLVVKISWLAAAASAMMTAALVVFVASFYDHAVSHHHAGDARLAAALARRVYEDPSPRRLARLANTMKVGLRYQNAHFSFTSDEGMPHFHEVQILRRRGDIALGRGNGQLVALHSFETQRLMIDLRRGGPWEAAAEAIVLLAAALTILWSAFYFLQRKMLSPIADLRDDMKAVGAGNWQHSKVKQNDEIGELAEVFNQMQDRLQAMIVSKERFLADASHELRSPLARLRLAAEFVERDKLRRQMTADIGELDLLTGDILEKARLDNLAESEAKARFDFNSVLRELQNKYPSVRFAGEVSAEVCGDPGALARALGNLLDNAHKFAVEEICLSVMQEDGFIITTVEDDGPGASEEDLLNLFEPFYRADVSRSRDTGGFGLGLSIARAAVISHDGEIFAQNKTPQGLKITIRLPVATEANENDTPPSAASRPETKSEPTDKQD